LASSLFGKINSGLIKAQSEILTSAKATKRFFERSFEMLSLKIVPVIEALASFKEIVFF